METAGIWLRVSTGDQHEENQLPDNLRYCEDKGYQVATPHYTVHGKSAYKGEQDPDWQKVVKDVKAGRIQVVVIWKVDRLDRQNILHAIPMVNAVFDAGGRIEFATQQAIDLTTGPGRIGFAMFVEQAHEESKTKSDRVRIFKSTIRANKAFDGRPPYGYQVIGQKYNKELVPDPVTGAVVSKIVAWYLAGDTLAVIANRLDELDIPVPNKRKPSSNGWATKTVHDLLTSETLIGTRRGAKGNIITRFEPLIDMDTWHKVQALIKLSARKRGSVVKAPGIFSDMAYCGTCGGIMHYRRIPDRKYPAYVWTGYRCDGTSKNPSTCRNMVSETAVDQAAAERVMVCGDWPNVVREWKMAEQDTAAELEDIELELRGLDYDAPDWREMQDRLIAKRAELKLRETKPGEWRYHLDGGTVAKAYESDKRAWLLEHGWTFSLRSAGRGEPPLVQVHSSESLLDMIAECTGLTADEIMAIDWMPILATLRERGLPEDPAEIQRLSQRPPYIPPEVKQAADRATDEFWARRQASESAPEGV